MMNKLQGRSMAHPGCLIGITSGLTLGIILAGVLAIVNVPLNVDLLIWLGLTIVLGATGWIIGTQISPRSSTEKEQSLENDTPTPPVTEEQGLSKVTESKIAKDSHS